MEHFTYLDLDRGWYHPAWIREINIICMYVPTNNMHKSVYTFLALVSTSTNSTIARKIHQHRSTWLHFYIIMHSWLTWRQLRNLL